MVKKVKLELEVQCLTYPDRMLCKQCGSITRDMACKCVQEGISFGEHVNFVDHLLARNLEMSNALDTAITGLRSVQDFTGKILEAINANLGIKA